MQQIKFAQEAVNYDDAVGDALKNFDDNSLSFAPKVRLLPLLYFSSVPKPCSAMSAHHGSDFPFSHILYLMIPIVTGELN